MFNHRKPINQTIFANVFVPRIHQFENPSKSPSSNRSTWDGIHHDRGSSRDEPMGMSEKRPGPKRAPEARTDGNRYEKRPQKNLPILTIFFWYLISRNPPGSQKIFDIPMSYGNRLISNHHINMVIICYHILISN